MNYLLDYLKKNNYTLSSCESFTGGLFAHSFTNISGASNYFKGGYVCYSNEFKIEQLNINEQIIKNHSEVSLETLVAMLNNTQDILKTDVCFAFTGFATPIDKSNPRTGLSYVGFAIKDKQYSYEFVIKEDISREQYKIKAIDFLLNKFKEI
ncbi:competence damage-inducible protein A [Spiroplasma helicoides]|uniref:Competence damage-inducible protein A n=1 Tax=Spiroplasma helicoides TaxID=216938 RepID=A0A1B3SJV8_9MOLU|nr:nicotinamide-nucleotide amidohydrolase family protein [Spiroplasma helicoides]AOG60219.1 competence damage-inducible protein A [Spiroplasma helicoides]